MAKSFARIHWQNLINFGILPLTFSDPADWERIDVNDTLVISDVRQSIEQGQGVTLFNQTQNHSIEVSFRLTDRQIEMILAGALINVVRKKYKKA